MVKYIKANNDSQFFHPAIEELEYQANRAGYDMEVDGDNFEEAIIKFTATKDADMMPEIEGWFDTKSSGDPNLVYYDFKITYPVIRTDEMKYADSLAYWTQRWNDVAQMIDWSFRNSIELDIWEDIEEE